MSILGFLKNEHKALKRTFPGLFTVYLVREAWSVIFLVKGNTFTMGKILIIEDDVQYRELIQSGLEAAGFEVETVADGETALNILEHRDFDLIILDLILPKMDGIGFLYHLKNDLKKDVPTMILSNLERSAYPSGVRDFLIKSDVTIDDIAAKVKEYLG